MADTNDMKQTFANLGSAAQSGKFMINDDIVGKLVACCNSYIQDLRTLSNKTQRLVRADAFGSLGSATALGSKFDDLGSSTTPGSGSLAFALQQHVETVQGMIDMFNKAGQAFQHADSETQAKIRAVTRNVG
ncbi:hypothetical protein [Nocardia alni]|uniref:hypothetical protein n=1 Tax=Nocardia alni TaxID=2815723 RepID=UPI001C242794|nr:hypothetical protein [Nocardia alni]